MFMISESQRRNYLLFYIKLAHFKLSMTGFLKDVVITYKSFKRKRNKVNSLLYSKINFFFFFFCCAAWLAGSQFPHQGFKKDPHCQGSSGCGEACSLFYCWWECQLAWSFWKAVWQYVSKVTSFDIVFLLLGIYLKGLMWHSHMYKDIQFSIVYKNTRLKEAYLSFSERWVKWFGGELMT